MKEDIQGLEPKALWRNFAGLNAIPRPSGKEERVVAFMQRFGRRLGLDTAVDEAGNVCIRKAASPGKEDRPVLVLQGHLDMVHQKNAGNPFDFEKEGIRCLVDGDWVRADGTTLGADNGIGVAAIMAVLEAGDIPHPPLEALFTTDEERGMTGAKALRRDLLKGRILLNLDTENDDELTIGCAGGIDTNTRMNYREERTPARAAGFLISVRGLRGGHSGMDIHLGRANANKVLTRLLYRNTHPFGMRIADLDGGSLRNAIPREASAHVIAEEKRAAAFQKEFQRRAEAIREAYRSIEPGMQLLIEKGKTPAKVMAAEDQDRALNALYAVTNGVYRMSPDIEGLVESSSSLARVQIKNGEFITQSLQRSSLESGKEDVAFAVRAAFEAVGAAVENKGDYPGWTPNPQSPILKLTKSLYEKSFGETPRVEACHAGLECGIIGNRFPGMDMISFGPTIQHAHAPDERVSISSVQKFWKYLLAVLDQV